MIHNNVLPASLDQIDQVVVFYRVELTKVQQLASSLADRVKTLNDANQKALEAKVRRYLCLVVPDFNLTPCLSLTARDWRRAR